MIDSAPDDYRQRAATACTHASWLFAEGKDKEARHQLMRALYASDQITKREKKASLLDQQNRRKVR